MLEIMLGIILAPIAICASIVTIAFAIGLGKAIVRKFEN